MLLDDKHLIAANKKLDSEISKAFCPVASASCRTNCVCIQKLIKDDSEHNLHYITAKCTNPALSSYFIDVALASFEPKG